METLIKSETRVKKYGEVYTPSWLVKEMCDNLPQEARDDIDVTFLESSCGNGNFLVEIFSRKLEKCHDYQEGLRALMSITGIDILPDNCEESRERLLNMYSGRFLEGQEEAKAILERQIICGDSLEIMRKWHQEQLKQDIGSLMEALLEKVTIKPKPDKDGKTVSVIEWHDDCPLRDYLRSALEVYEKSERQKQNGMGGLLTKGENT